MIELVYDSVPAGQNDEEPVRKLLTQFAAINYVHFSTMYVGTSKCFGVGEETLLLVLGSPIVLTAERTIGKGECYDQLDEAETSRVAVFDELDDGPG